MVHVSRRLAEIPPYAFAEMKRTVRRLRSEGVDVIDLGVGDPVRPAPPGAREACRAGIDRFATTGYPPYEGIPELRAAVVAYMSRSFGVDLDEASEVLVTDGAKEAIFHLPGALVDPGEGVLVPSPGYVPYYRGTSFAGGIAIPYPLAARGGFLPDVPDLRARIESAARRGTTVRLLWICHPNAPTGSVADAGLLAAIVAMARDLGIVVASDEAYADFVWEGRAASALQAGKEGVIAFHSLSKRSNMTGYRVGWVSGDSSIVSSLARVKENVDSGTPCFVQAAAAVALGDESHVDAMRAEYRHNRDVLLDALGKAGLPSYRPAGALYLWQAGLPGMSSTELCGRFLDEKIAVAVLPGEALSPPLDDGTCPGAGYVRLSLTALPERVEEAARRIRAHLRFRP